MQKLKLTALLLISIAALSGCSKAESTATTEKVDRTQSITTSPQEDIYTMEYRLCGKKCEANTSQIVTWGKPTEVGIVYYDGGLTETTTKLLTTMDQRRMRATYFLVKCKGTSPALLKPLKIDRFVPVETYPRILISAAGIDNKPPAKYGHVEIVSIKKLPNPKPGNEYAIASQTLLTKARDPNMVSNEKIAGYFSYSLDRPEIKPQQVDPITWQEGQTPQIIPVKAW
jgi:hypothetical protein